MNDLLSDVLGAHGGLERWTRVASLTVEGSLGGPFWAAKGWPEVFRDQRVTLDPHRVDITFEPYPRAGRRAHFHSGPERLEIRERTGELVEGRDRPRESFPPTDPSPRWDAIQTAYFTSCAMWSYVTAPFVLTYPGVTTEEIEPWTGDGPTWRRLAVHFPPDLPNHNPDQVFYFGEDFLLRRLDYHPEVTDSPIAHEVDAYREFGGLMFPTRRRVHVRDADGRADRSGTPITIDIDAVRVETA